MTESIDIKHIARVEGHGSLYVTTKDKELVDVKMAVDEGARLFEAFLRGREYTEVPEMACRICAICSASHRVASTKAVEKAMGIKVDQQVVDLRRLLVWGEYIESHILHALYLALPDYVGHESVISAAADFPEVVKIALKLKKLGNDMQILTGGREVHQVSTAVGGFTSYPTHQTLDEIKERINEARADLQKCLDVWATLEEPDFERKTTYVSIKRDDEYALVDGDLITSEGHRVPVEKYKEIIGEDQPAYSFAKSGVHDGHGFFVGALPRLNNNTDQLSPFAKKALSQLGIKLPSYNTFHNNAAQLIETAQVFDMAIDTIDALLKSDLEWHEFETVPKAGFGTHITEAPRGSLVHSYEFGDDGLLKKADIIAPTTMNYLNMEEDVRALYPSIADLPRPELELMLNRLIRAYDPCISCSCHVAEVK
ncbi:MAG: Hydrogenase/sulfur reductase subunit alpha [Candidatus Thorarchaeota archaeon]|nr:MAG: Hydrogenase/sulfur reductase subunit alpha [Candidatus Thorarchaeota archaeon]